MKSITFVHLCVLTCDPCVSQLASNVVELLPGKWSFSAHQSLSTDFESDISLADIAMIDLDALPGRGFSCYGRLEVFCGLTPVVALVPSSGEAAVLFAIM